MIDISKLDGIDHPSFYMEVLTSLREFDGREMEGVLAGLLGITKREECFFALYLRAQRNIDTLINLKHVAHFQAIAMLGRAVFELCLDSELLVKTPDGDLRMRTYKRLELLRAARSLQRLEDTRSNDRGPSERSKYIAEIGPEIELQASELWPNRGIAGLKHWSGMNTAQRAKALGSDTHALYIHSYQQFSWYVHGGIQGTLDVPPDHFPRVCGMALSLAVVSYSRMLGIVGRALRLTTHDPDFDRKLELALGLPRSESAEDELNIRRHVGLS